MLGGFLLAVLTYFPVFTAFTTFKDNPVLLTLLVFYLVILVTMVYGPICRLSRRDLPGADSLQLDVTALSRRQWRLRRRRAVHCRFACRGLSRRDVWSVSTIPSPSPRSVVVVGFFGFKQTHLRKIWG